MSNVATLFNEPSPEKSKKMNRGRDADVHARQSEAIADRYFYYTKIKEKNYNAALRHISDEFFLAKVTVGHRVRAMYRYLVQLKKNPLTVKELETKWPWIQF